jgi:phage FluMu protein Com
MSITFRCEHCNKEVKAPDAAGGKRGKCPFCGQSNYIPSPVSEADILDLAPEDPQEERRRAEKLKALYQKEHDLIAQSGASPAVPLEHKEQVTSDDLHHFVINYCLAMARGNIEAADLQLTQLRKFGALSARAVEDIAGGKVREPELEKIPRLSRGKYLNILRERLK